MNYIGCYGCKHAEWYSDAKECRCEKLNTVVTEPAADCCYRDTKKMTNADRIRQMTDEELFVFLNEITDCCFSNNDCDNCPMKYSDELYYRCNIEAWLKQEVKTDDER
jgi:hypothetical protein